MNPVGGSSWLQPNNMILLVEIASIAAHKN